MNNKPNILVLLAEDMCPNLGCYGDLDAITPNLDKLAKDGVRYTRANSVAPVCSAARTTLALGIYPFTAGVGNHRSFVKLPDNMKSVPFYMHDEGYFCAINKTDYNFACKISQNYVEGWDAVIPGKYFEDSAAVPESICKTWRQRGDKPFFFMSTFACTHQSRYGFPDNAEEHRKVYAPRTTPEQMQDRSKLHIPDYHFDNKDTREIWGQYHEAITAMDRMVGETIEHLKEDNIYDDTIIIFAGDNGMGIPTGKANMWDEGNHVPLIVRIPPKYSHLAKYFKKGTDIETPVNFIDLAPTVISLAGGKIPEHMHGKDFLNEQSKTDCAYSYRNRIDGIEDFVRSIRTDNLLYIRNFYPQRGYRFSSYMKRMSPYFVSSWEDDFKKSDDKSFNRKNAFFLDKRPIEELYDLSKDPFEMHNLASDANYQKDIGKFRANLSQFMLSVHDLGFIPEEECDRLSKEKNVTVYEATRDDETYPITEITALTNKMLDKKMSDSEIERYLDDKNQLIRYWAIQYVSYFEMKSMTAKLVKMMDDTNLSVRVAASEALLSLTDDQNILKSSKTLMGKVMDSDNLHEVLCAVGGVTRSGKKTADLIPHLDHLRHCKQNGCDDARMAGAITDQAYYYPETQCRPFSYDDEKLDEKLHKRLLILREINFNKNK